MYFNTLDKFYIDLTKTIDIYDYYYNKVNRTFFWVFIRPDSYIYALRV